jgi:hypothetical protein
VFALYPFADNKELASGAIAGQYYPVVEDRVWRNVGNSSAKRGAMQVA